MMTSAEDSHGTADDSRAVPPRHGQPWTEEDFAGVMRSCRAGRSHEEIARDIGRSPQGLRGQLRRLLPPEERHLPSDLVLSRLRQLDQDGDYDWLAAMAARPTPAWDWRSGSRPAEEAQGFGALSDDHVLNIAVTALFSAAPLRDDLQDLLVRQVRHRGLEERLHHSARGVAEDAVAASWGEGASCGCADSYDVYGGWPSGHEIPGRW